MTTTRRRWPLSGALLIAASLCAESATWGAPVRPATTLQDRCLQNARRKKQSAGAGTDYHTARRALEIELARCLDPKNLAAATLTGALNADYARMGAEFVTGALTLDAYAAVLRDRRQKMSALSRDKKDLASWMRGDADEDFVPDERDHCPGTTAEAPTDDNGCPVAVPTTFGAEQEAAFRRQLATMSYFHNPRCDHVPSPAMSMPIAFGEMGTMQFAAGKPAIGTGSPGKPKNAPTTGAEPPIEIELPEALSAPSLLQRGPKGVKIQVLRIQAQGNGCDLLYEVEFVFTGLKPPKGSKAGSSPWPVPYFASSVFRAQEDLRDDPSRASFWISYSKPASPSRDRLRAATGVYDHASWRVRVIDGGNKASSWSPYRPMAALPYGTIGGARPE